MINPNFTPDDDRLLSQFQLCYTPDPDDGTEAAERLADAIMREYSEEDERTARIKDENKALKHALCVSQSWACIGWITAVVAFGWALTLWWGGVAQ